ncbi:hypothetical protein SAMN02745157_1758 [Kaistia soli DSM 19436]|uniref:Short chain dehydrogenase n=1 Tax=Kaistia soli DSM 19436 TaxID=1122133 RepID=A0A1M4Z9U8_9HYPH|nr:hypothetical protein [Kaistia soli]SHF14811.1 hypothetical protein SAMN02745157_1758 [Kaistia soli DSM 19436]
MSDRAAPIPSNGTGLSIGGTGMLAAATHWLAAREAQTLVVSRHARRFTGDSERMVALDADWTQPDFLAAIETRLAAMPPVSRALLWLHKMDQHLSPLMGLLGSARIILMLGSMDGRPALPGTEGIVTVRLGSVATAGGRRWLSNDEISAGAIKALEDGRDRIVGELKPIS